MGYTHYKFNLERHRLDQLKLDPPLKLNAAWSVDNVGYPPKVHNRRVFMSFRDGQILAFDETTGALIWRYQLPGSYQPNPPCDGELLIDDDRVITRYRDKFIVLDATTGQLIRKFATPALNMRLGVVNNTQLISVFVDNQYTNFCTAYDLQKGMNLWQVALDWLPSHLAFSHQRVFLETAANIVTGLNAKNGQVLWQNSVGRSDQTVSGIIVWNDIVLVAINPHTLSAFDALTGKLIWTQQVPIVNPQYMAVYPDNRAYLLDFRYACSLDLNLGQLVHTIEIDAALKSYHLDVPTQFDVTDNYLYLSDVYSGVLVAMHKETGEIHWSFTCDSSVPVLHAPLAFNGQLFLVDERGKLYVFTRGPDEKTPT